MTRLFSCLLVCCLLLSLSAFGVYAAGYDVNQDGTGDFYTIQEAIDAAVDDDVIVVHPGTYYENIHFSGKNIILRSLDPEDEQIVASTAVDGRQNGSVVTFKGTEDETCLLSGFTITNGMAEEGGGILGGDLSSDPPVRALAAINGCRISRNTSTGANWGGAGLCWCGGSISNCAIIRNSADYYGGGLSMCSGPIRNCTISGNSATWYGGGLYACKGTISDSTISSNSAMGDYGSGGGLDEHHGPIRNCTISDNQAGYEGGGLRACDGTISNCTISGNSTRGDGGGLSDCHGTISNCAISGNSAEYRGGGLIVCSGTITNCAISGNCANSCGGGLAFCNGTISNCTISGNSVTQDFGVGGGLYNCHGTIGNCIIWANEAPEGPELSYCWADVVYSCIRGWTGGGEGNISDDPLFVTGPVGDYYLSSRAAGQEADSPCIDAGSGAAEDLGLAARLTTRTDGVPDAGTVDMGYHYPLTLDQNPQIECSLNESEFAPGDALVGFIEAHNPGPDVVVDGYVAFVLPDGAIISLTASGLAIGTYPWVSNVVLPSGFDFGPTQVLRTTVPQSPGDYLFAAALTNPGQFDFIGEPSLFPFSITE